MTEARQQNDVKKSGGAVEEWKKNFSIILLKLDGKLQRNGYVTAWAGKAQNTVTFKPGFGTKKCLLNVKYRGPGTGPLILSWISET